jgi:hypothetical protein
MLIERVGFYVWAHFLPKLFGGGWFQSVPSPWFSQQSIGTVAVLSAPFGGWGGPGGVAVGCVARSSVVTSMELASVAPAVDPSLFAIGLKMCVTTRVVSCSSLVRRGDRGGGGGVRRGGVGTLQRVDFDCPHGRPPLFVMDLMTL